MLESVGRVASSRGCMIRQHRLTFTLTFSSASWNFLPDGCTCRIPGRLVTMQGPAHITSDQAVLV